jgi:hypothetical protein
MHEAFPAPALPTLQIVHDELAALAAATGVTAVSDTTETAVRVHAGRIVARADGLGAAMPPPQLSAHPRRPIPTCRPRRAPRPGNAR